VRIAPATSRSSLGEHEVKKIALIGGLIFVLLIAAAIWFAFFANYSEGYRVGQVIKFSHKGYVIKTWEGTLDQGFLIAGTNPNDPALATRLWDFSVDSGDEQVRQEFDAALTHGDKVKLYYHQKLFQFGWRGDTPYFVYKVEKVSR
jgi:hypothetical protein